MNVELLAHKYAAAFFAVFPASCVQENIVPLKKLYSFFINHKEVLFFLDTAAIDKELKRKVLCELMTSVAFKGPLEKLCVLLFDHKRIALLANVCNQMRLSILDKYNMLECAIVSSSAISQDNKKLLAQFFAHKTSKKIYAKYVVDTALIAGIALRSTTYAWEYSIRKQLHNINRTLII